jgi:predicted permease
MDEQHERQIQEEIEFHRAMREKKYREQYGLNEQQAAERAKRDFGGFERWKEVCRDVGRWTFLDDAKRDARLALRLLRKSPVFTVVALVTLTLSIGATTAIFSLMNAVFVKALPIPEPQQIVLLARPQSPSGYNFNYPLFRTLENESAPVLDTFAFQDRELQLRQERGISIVQGEFVSGRYFTSLRVKPKLGRWIGPSDDLAGSPNGAVAVASDRFWRSTLNSDPGALGHKLILNNTVVSVIGVMPNSFRGMNRDSAPDLYLPIELEPAIDAPLNLIQAGTRAWWLRVGARLKSDISASQANVFLKAKFSRLFEKPEREFLVALPGAKGFSMLRTQFERPLRVLMGLAFLVLLLACLNLSTLSMARAASREREITTRFALGASHGRLLRQLLTESLLLATAGTLLGFAFSPAAARLLGLMLSLRHDAAPARFDVAPDTTVLLFSGAILALATILSGVLPAMRTTHEAQHAVRGHSANWRGPERRKFSPRVLLSIEIALALVLTTGAVLLSYSLFKLRSIPLGYDPNGLIVLALNLGKHPIDSAGMDTTYRQLVKEIGLLPGVTSVSLTSGVPTDGDGMPEEVRGAQAEAVHTLSSMLVGPNYFQTMRIRLLQGRELQRTDGWATHPVILSLSAARLLFPNQDALGKEVMFQNGQKNGHVVGIVADAKNGALRDSDPPMVYSAALAKNALVGMAFMIVVRINGPVTPFVSAARNVARKAMPDIPPMEAFSVKQLIANSTATESAMAGLALFFAGLALLVTGIGLYGALAYATQRRTGEIGIRLALGGTPSKVIALVAKENSMTTLLGSTVGVLVSAAASKTIASFLYGVSPTDPLVFGFAACLLLATAVCASLIPAIKASRIDPASAIRRD